MHILVADDHQDLLELMCLFLQRAGHVVSACSNPREVLSILERESPDVLMIDASLEEEGDGLRLVQAALSVKPSLKAVVFSADRFVEPQARAAGAHLVLIKPLSPDTILTNLESLYSSRDDD